MAYVSMGEAHRRVADFLSRFADALDSSDGDALRRLFAVSSPSSYLRLLSDALPLLQDPTRVVKQSEQYAVVADIVLPLLRCLLSFRKGNLVDAYSAYEKSANAFLQEFRNWESAWALVAIQTVAFEIRILAEKADRELDSCGKTPDKLIAAGSFLMKVFGCLAGKGPKRVGALYVTCQLFKTYFKLGTVHLCRSVIRSIETARIFDFEEFPVGDKVTYMYYTGRLEVFNDNFLNADEKLSYALKHCNPRSEANIRMILKYLIPVKLSLGILPTEGLLDKYSLHEYKDVVQALKRGDLRLLRYVLQEHEDRFLRSGVYLVLEKLELQVYQRLMKKIYMIQRQKDPSKAHQVKLDVVVKTLKWLEMDIDVDEVECIIFRSKQNIQPDVYTYTSIIYGLFCDDRPQEATKLFREMKGNGVVADCVTYSTIIDALCKDGKVQAARLLLGEMLNDGPKPNVITYTSIIDGFIPQNKTQEAEGVFYLMENHGASPNVVSYNALIHGFCKCGGTEKAFVMLEKMMEKGIKPTIITYNTVLNGLCKEKKIKSAMSLFTYLKNHNLLPNTETFNIMLNGLCNAQYLEEALELFSKPDDYGPKRSIISYDIMINGCCRFGIFEKGRDLFDEISRRGLSADVVAYNTIIYWLCKKDMCEEAHDMFLQMQKNECKPNVKTFDLLLHGFFKKVMLKIWTDKEKYKDVYEKLPIFGEKRGA